MFPITMAAFYYKLPSKRNKIFKRLFIKECRCVISISLLNPNIKESKYFEYNYIQMIAMFIDTNVFR